MRYHSLTSDLSGLSLSDALLSTGSVDGHVLMPDSLPRMPRAFFNNCSEMRLNEIAYVVDNLLFGTDLASSTIKDIVDASLSFPIHLKNIEDNISVLELFHGPTMTIKDIASRFMAQMIKAIKPKDLNIVIASTGNKGAAVANCLQNIDNVRVFVLFPKSTPRTLVARFTGISENVRAVEVDGTIDDCRRLCHTLMQEPGLTDKYKISSATSAGLALMLPLTFIFVYAYAQAVKQSARHVEVQFGIPMANGTSLAASLTAAHMGLPMLPPVAVVPVSYPSSAFALDTEQPSNGPRIKALGDKVIYDRVTDDDIADTINDVYARTGYTFDPHGAAAYIALKRNLAPGATGIVLATAHPALSIDKMTQITGRAIELPLSLTRFMGIMPSTVKIPPTYPAFKRYLSKFNHI